MAKDSTFHRVVAGICVLAVVGLVMGHVSRVAIREELNDVTKQLEKTTATMKTMVPKEAVEQLQAKNRELANQLTATQAKLEKAETKLASIHAEPAAVPTARVGGSPMASTGKTDAGAGTGDGAVADAQPEQKSGFKGLASMFEGKQGKKMAEFAAKSAVDMQYAEFLQELNLDPDTEAQVRQIIQTAMVDQITKSMGSMDKAFDPGYAEEMEQTLTDRLQNELSEVLDGNQMAIWEEYEATKQERLLTKQYDMQLSMFASGLAPEDRAVAADVMVDEALAMQEARKNDPNAQHGVRAELDAQLQAFENARARLAQQFDDQQMAQLDRFIEQQKNSVELVAGMMENMANEDIQPEEPPMPPAENK